MPTYDELITGQGSRIVMSSLKYSGFTTHLFPIPNPHSVGLGRRPAFLKAHDHKIAEQKENLVDKEKKESDYKVSN